MVRRYTPEDYPEVASWGLEAGEVYDPKNLPSIGFIVPGVAAQFLYTTDSNICFIENLVANPNTSKELRDVAIKCIVDQNLMMAKSLGYKVAYACTNIPAVIERAKQYGTVCTPNYTLLQKKLD
jgi:hypothetical protein